MKSDKPAARKFTLAVTKLVAEFRRSKMRALEEEVRVMREEQQRPAHVYLVKDRDGQVVYVGKDSSKNQQRWNQHLRNAKQIRETYQRVDAWLAVQDVNDIVLEIRPSSKDECEQLERELIQKHQPVLNQQHNPQSIYKCARCGRMFKSRKPFEKHTQSHTQEHTQEHTEKQY